MLSERAVGVPRQVWFGFIDLEPPRLFGSRPPIEGTPAKQ